ncbi:DUF3500 domain-containing protein [Parendozoicomonas haliclonae]|uniref:Uncharacterized protein n=1 Tax=Parendozoicomonas haliclonae TaxID=1960125 RepID=A0A1X7AG85_9GAMM|nr:DUF3500 domain-containing protein [Parendozoicomonas haliclonae]SMA32313.1 hypothetical protein EHSB41UT_00138 [Parendozoicomonas haliclonae]
MKVYCQYLAYLIIIVAFCELVTAAQPGDMPGDGRHTALYKELEQQQHDQQQARIEHRFNQLKSWFSEQELNMMSGDQPGIHWLALQPEQRIAVHSFLMTALSQQGYLQLNQQIRMLNTLTEIGSTSADASIRLSLTDTDKSAQVMLRGANILLSVIRQQQMWDIETLAFGQWPRQIPPAPMPDLSSQQSVYPYRHWQESMGTAFNSQTLTLAADLLRSLSDQQLSMACMGEMVSPRQCTMKSSEQSQTASQPITPLMAEELSARGRFLLHELIMNLSGNLLSSGSSGAAGLTWTGLVPRKANTQTYSTYAFTLTLKQGEALWQVVVMDNESMLGMTISYSRDGKSLKDLWKHSAPLQLAETNQVEPASQNELSPTLLPAGGMQEPTLDEQEGPVWLKSPAFLNGLTFSMGYQNQKVEPGQVFIPVVEVKKDGRIHKNIKVSVTLLMKDREEPWLEDHPLSFRAEEQSYQAEINLPENVPGDALTIIFSIHEPGTRFEGVYEYPVPLTTSQ